MWSGGGAGRADLNGRQEVVGDRAARHTVGQFDDRLGGLVSSAHP
jgi:hypothetical protein